MAYKDELKQRDFQKKYFQDNKQLWRYRQQQRRIQNKNYLNEVKKAGCSICGYNKCADALDFHHLNDDKDKSVSSAARLHCLETLKKEVSKCILVCSNCHREIHFNERNKASLALVLNPL